MLVRRNFFAREEKIMAFKTDGNSFLRLVKKAALGTAVGMLVTLALIFVLSLLTAAGTIGEKLAGRLTLAAALTGSAAAGALTADAEEGGVVKAGLIGGVMYLLILTAILVFMPEEGEKGQAYGRIIIASIAGGTFGGVLRIGKKRKKSKLRR